jgi:type I restriction enzyme M protein
MATATEQSKIKDSSYFSSRLRQNVDQLMDILSAGGLDNPLDAIEQCSYLLFLRLLTEKDEALASLDRRYKSIFSGPWARFSWGSFVTLAGDELFNVVHDAIEKLHELPGLMDTGKLLFSRATLKIRDLATLHTVVRSIDELDLAAHDGHDFKLDTYDYLLSKLSASSARGPFRTPRHIIDLVTALVDPQPGQRICDPACGTAEFLTSAFNHILRRHTKATDLKRGLTDGALLKPAQWKFLEQEAFTGFESNAGLVKLASFNLHLHQLEQAHIFELNPLTTGFGTYPGRLFDVMLGSHPFSSSMLDEDILPDLNYKLGTRATELLFLKWFIDHLAPNGRAGVIVPNGVLFEPANAAASLRQLLLMECDLQAVISFPNGVFTSNSGAAALIFQRGRSTRSVWFYDLRADGFSPDDQRTPVEANDIPDLLAKWPRREEGPNSHRVAMERIHENGWSLVADRYRPAATTVADQETPMDILNDVLKLESEIILRLNALLLQISGKK